MHVHQNVYVCDRDDTVKLRLKMSAKDSLLIHPLFFFGGILAVLLLFCRIFFENERCIESPRKDSAIRKERCQRKQNALSVRLFNGRWGVRAGVN